MKKHKSEDYKISAVQYYIEHNKTQTNICKILKCSRRSLMRWVKRYKNENEKSIKRHNRNQFLTK